MHLTCLFGLFFLTFFACMFAYTSIRYVATLKETVIDQFDTILNDRLVYSTQAVSTMFYMIDNIGIDSSKRLSGVY